MTKRDFRIRRGLIRQGKIRNRRDFASFQSEYEQHNRNKGLPRIAVLVLIGLTLALAVYFVLVL